MEYAATFQIATQTATQDLDLLVAKASRFFGKPSSTKLIKPNPATNSVKPAITNKTLEAKPK